jgi:hypothetical protein
VQNYTVLHFFKTYALIFSNFNEIDDRESDKEVSYASN